MKLIAFICRLPLMIVEIIVGHLIGVMLLCVICSPILVCMSWWEVERIRDVQARGIEARALIVDGIKKSSLSDIRHGRDGIYSEVTLAWKDVNNHLRSARGVKVSRTFARTLVQSRVQIKYLLDDPKVMPLVIGDDEKRDESVGMLWFSSALTGILLAGSGFLFWRRWRRKGTVASSIPMTST